MRRSRLIVVLVASGAILALVLMTVVWALGQSSSQTQNGTMSPTQAATASPAPTSTPSPPRTVAGGQPGCQVFPPDNPWNTDISDLPVHPLSDAYIDAIGRDENLHPDFGTVWEDAPNGIPYLIVSGHQLKVPVYVFVADAIKRKYDDDFYAKLKIAANEFQEQGADLS